MKLEVLKGRESVKEVLENNKLKDISYIFNTKRLKVEYLLLYIEGESEDKAILVDYGGTSTERDKLERALLESPDFLTAVENINSTGEFVCLDPNNPTPEDLIKPEADIVVISEKLLREQGFGKELISVNLKGYGQSPVSGEEIKELLRSDDLEKLNNLLLEDKVEVDIETLEDILSDCSEYDPGALEVFLGHVLFRFIDEEESQRLFDLFMDKYDRADNQNLKKILMEKAIYTYARLVEDLNTYKELKSLLEQYMEEELSEEERAFTIYEVITSLRTDNIELLKSLLYSFDKYVPYTEEFSPLIFGDLGMSFYTKWEDTGNQDYRELSVVLLQKSVFSLREILKLGKTQDMPINLSNVFAYISVLIPLLADEMENSPSREIRDIKAVDIKECICLGLQLFLEFSEEVNLENFAEVYPTLKDAELMVESTFENFVSMMESYFDSGIETESEELWEETVGTDIKREKLVEAALKLRENLCPER
ncbi:hypothetical protein BCF55_0498 [Hydrogenivirga caldilitoris]|uniref:Uncharacterized protein n=1 Tax=Hydrogenivirga caldilitoris TaxID=246264 RepID=A0A497XSX6_9AQUI|nr:hypothetical protein [Hydrogenivirga caldilitoris]RLJ70232.1 hypothetical protein BCF55_0498 [Hydrogenivirga caldilitoris]